MVDFHGRFLWYELMTTDVEAAKAFYAGVVGWGTQVASSSGISYSLFIVGDVPVGGLMSLPEDARKIGAQPLWLGYVGVKDVDTAACRIKQLGGTVHLAPVDIPDVGSYLVMADPQMATLALIKRSNSRQSEPEELDKPGHVGWHELLAADREKAFTFYSELFDWRKADAEVDALSTYQPFSIGGKTIGGMFTKPPAAPLAFWLYYFNVGDVSAAAKRVTAGGGQILEGPIDVPGGSRVARCADPQGTMFALTESQKEKAIGYFERAAFPSRSQGRRWSW